MKKFAPTDVKIKCKLTIFVDRTFQIEIWAPITSGLIKWKLHLAKGSGEPNKNKVGKLSRADLEEIYEIKKDDLNANSVEEGIRIIAGTARNMWVDCDLK